MLANVREGIDRISAAAADGSKPLYFEFSPKSLKLLEQHGAIPTTDGFFRSMVHDGSQFAGNVDWKRSRRAPNSCNCSPPPSGRPASVTEGTRRRRSASRRQGRPSHRSHPSGAGRRDRRPPPCPDELIDASDDGHPMSSTDWSSIEHLRTEIVATSTASACSCAPRRHTLTAGGRRRAEPRRPTSCSPSSSSRPWPPRRSERNLAAWHRLRVQRVERSEPEHLERTIGRVESDLALHRAEDQRLVDDLTGFIDGLASPNGLEGLELWKRNQLARDTRELRRSIDDFAASVRRTSTPAAVENCPPRGRAWSWRRTAASRVPDGCAIS